MCTALFKVTMWQVKLVIKTPNNITNIFFYYLYFILSSLHNIRKDGYNKNTVIESVIIPSKPSPPRDNEQKSGIILTGHRWQEQSIPSEIFGDPLRKPGNFGTTKSPKEHRDQKNRQQEWRPPRILEGTDESFLHGNSNKFSDIFRAQFRKISEARSENIWQLWNLLRKTSDIKN